jgi:AcrR family transcriptional regulator
MPNPPIHARATGRRAGRPPGEAADQRARLLDAAVTCYSRLGIAATSLRSIAREAGVNPALIHYYFGDKQQLQEAVIQERLFAAIETVRAPLLQAGGDLAGLVAAFVDGMADAVARFPWMPALWVREVLCEGGALRGRMLDRVAPLIPQALAARFAMARQQGDIDPRLDPRLLVVSMVGLTLFPAAVAPIWRQMFDAADIDPDVMRSHTLALLDKGLGLK